MSISRCICCIPEYQKRMSDRISESYFPIQKIEEICARHWISLLQWKYQYFKRYTKMPRLKCFLNSVSNNLLRFCHSQTIVMDFSHIAFIQVKQYTNFENMAILTLTRPMFASYRNQSVDLSKSTDRFLYDGSIVVKGLTTDCLILNQRFSL